ncbi:MAG TPA: IPT/TIG domain-containing protein [Kofleriaceae bacterium]|nr:IPT/TIG domain-containing protein [Kofleriaceae bacterium]
MKRALVLLAACSAPADHTPVIRAVTPPHGPLAGGTRVVIEGAAFTGGGPVRVLVGGREAPLAYTLDDHQVELVLPPGEHPGDTEVVVFNRNGSAVTNAFRYSTPPTITAVAPAELLYTGVGTVTVTGTGFLHEGAGEATLLLDGEVVAGAHVRSDTELAFPAPEGRPLARPRLEVVNARGTATRERAFRYRPSMRSGLLLFTLSSDTFAMFFDPVDRSFVSIPRIGGIAQLSSVIADGQGEFWGVDRGGGSLGRLDLSTQRFGQTAPIGYRSPAITRVGDRILGIDRWTARLIQLSLDGTYAYVGTDTFPCCGSFGLAWDGATLYYTARNGNDRVLGTVDPTTGRIGPPIRLLGSFSFHVEELRAYGGKLYATSRDGTFVQIDAATGVVTRLATIPRSLAMDVFE